MSFVYKNPLTPLISLGNQSVQRTNIFGTNFSILSTGGYMEVYTLNDLFFNVPPSTIGLIEYSGNTIPIQLNISNGSPFSFNVLTLNSDNISSGRRRIGMLVYVIGLNEFYQYQIPNFNTLWNNATGATGIGGSTVVFSDFGTTIKSNSPEGNSFISAWTANTVEGYSGETASTAVWKKFTISGGTASGDYLPLSGGTVTGDTVFTSGLTANTISASTYLNLPIDVFVTGATYSSGDAVFTNNTGGTFVLSGLTTPFTGGTIPGPLNCLGGLSANTISASTYQNLPIDVFVTGGTYSAGTATFTNNTGGTFSVSGFNEQDLYITGGTFDKDTETLTLTNNTGGTVTVTGFTDIFVTGGTYSTGTITFTNNSGTTFSVSGLYTGGTDVFVTGGTYSAGTATFTNNTGGTFDVSGFTTPFTGGTVSGDTVFLSGLTANTISASTYQNLPIDAFVTGGTFDKNLETLTLTNNTGGTITITGFTDVFVTGGTYSSGSITFTNNSGGTFSVSGLFTGNTDVFVTGGTYSNGTATFTNNTGGTFTVSGFTNPFTGGTVSGATIFTNGLTANTISASTYFNLPIDIFVTGGTYSAGTATFTNNTGGTFTVSGFNEQDLYITGGTFDKNTETLTLTNNSGSTIDITGFTDVFVTGGTYSGGTLALTNNSGTTFNVTGFYTGSTDVFVTGATYNNANTLTFTNNTGGTFSVLFNTFTGLTATTISATTYQNLPGGLLYFVQSSTPTAIQSGDRWFDTNTGIEVVWIDDGDSSQWVQPFSVPGPLSPDVGYYQATGITSSQTLNWNYTYWGISGASNVDLTLPTTTTSKNGYYLIIKDEAGTCGFYRIRVTPASGLIDGNNYIDMNINYMSLTFMVRNGNWYLI